MYYNGQEYSSLSIVLRKRKASSPAQPKPSGADQKVAEKVRYTTGGGTVKLGQNAAYKEAKYKYDEEAIYEVPTWSAHMLYALHECSVSHIFCIVVSYCI